jgi:hypothetical protein
MKSRDAKTRVLYCLNYFRAIQKRLALDLREFGTRDRIDGHVINPFIFSNETPASVERNANWAKNMFEKKQTGGSDKEKEEEGNEKARKTTVFDNDSLEKIKNMASVRMYKVNGCFNSKVFSTCPAYPKFHIAYGENCTDEPSSAQIEQD